MLRQYASSDHARRSFALKFHNDSLIGKQGGIVPAHAFTRSTSFAHERPKVNMRFV